MVEAGVLVPDLEEKLRLGMVVVEGGRGGDIHTIGAGQGGPAAREREEEAD